MDHHDFEFKFAADVTNKTVGFFSGIASTPQVDSYNDIVAPTAFTETIAKRGVKGHGSIKMLYQHNSDEPIGNWEKIETRGENLYVEGLLSKSLPKFEEYHALVKEEMVTGLSIGFRIQERSYNEDTNIRTITKLDLREISIVTFPANPGTNIIGIKREDGDKPIKLCDFEKAIAKEFGLSRREAEKIVNLAKSGGLLITKTPIVETVPVTEDYSKTLSLIEEMKAEHLAREIAKFCNSVTR